MGLAVNIDGIGAVLRRHRLSLGLPQYKMAKLAGVHQSAISKIESGHGRQARATTLASIAAALGVTIDDLLREAEAEAEQGKEGE